MPTRWPDVSVRLCGLPLYVEQVNQDLCHKVSNNYPNRRIPAQFFCQNGKKERKTQMDNEQRTINNRLRGEFTGYGLWVIERVRGLVEFRVESSNASST